ncbi:hypothetical protein MSAN_02027300 [Mycena sanguinolenta]|uniref:Uncharacterized protein n=1 Tax=Mycena sanguinolenta TaxID=230812 RepID=A0A8H6XLP2_9AGAR|nr:hypothetical protein MSAN_02027300 [Mycena sanguinolenta]
MEYIVHNVQQGLDATTLGASAVASGGYPFDWLVRSITASFPTPVTDSGSMRRVIATFNVVWMEEGRLGVIERLEVSRARMGTVDDSAVECLEVSCPRERMMDDSAAVRLEVSPSGIDDSAAHVSEQLKQVTVIHTVDLFDVRGDTMSREVHAPVDNSATISQSVGESMLEERNDLPACCSDPGAGCINLGDCPRPLGVRNSLSLAQETAKVMEKMASNSCNAPDLVLMVDNRQGRM